MICWIIDVVDVEIQMRCGNRRFLLLSLRSEDEPKNTSSLLDKFDKQQFQPGCLPKHVLSFTKDLSSPTQRVQAPLGPEFLQMSAGCVMGAPVAKFGCPTQTRKCMYTSSIQSNTISSISRTFEENKLVRNAWVCVQLRRFDTRWNLCAERNVEPCIINWSPWAMVWDKLLDSIHDISGHFVCLEVSWSVYGPWIVNNPLVSSVTWLAGKSTINGSL